MNPTIELKNIGKKFNREWIFKNVSQTITCTENLAIVGANGSGKSTLVKKALVPRLQKYLDGFYANVEHNTKHLNEI